MKTSANALLTLIIAATASAQDFNLTNRIATFTNLQGRVYQNVQLVRGDRESIIWLKDSGGGRIFYTNLAPELLESLGISTNWIETARLRAEKKALSTAQYRAAQVASAQEARQKAVDEYLELHAHTVWIWADHLRFPSNEEQQQACKELSSELKQVQKVLETGVSYNQFCDLLVQKTMAVQKLADNHSLPATAKGEAERALKHWSESRSEWHDQIYSPESKALNTLLRQGDWLQADRSCLVVEALATKSDPKKSVTDKEIEIIMHEQKEIEEGFGSMYTRLTPTELHDLPTLLSTALRNLTTRIKQRE